MALVPTFHLRQFRDRDGTVKLQQKFLEAGVVPVWMDVPMVDYNDPEEVLQRLERFEQVGRILRAQADDVHNGASQ